MPYPPKNRTEFITMTVERHRIRAPARMHSTSHPRIHYGKHQPNPSHTQHTLNVSIKRITHTSHVLGTANTRYVFENHFHKAPPVCFRNL